MGSERQADRLARWLYVRALRAFPREFLSRRRDELEWTFVLRLRDESGRGRAARWVFVGRELVGAVASGFRARRDAGRVGARVTAKAAASRSSLAEAVWRDVRQSIRALARNPGFAATAILVLGLGIGSSVAIFSAVNAVLIRPLPFPEQDRLVTVWEDNRERGWERAQVAPANWLDWRERVGELAGLAAYSEFLPGHELGGGGEPRRVLATSVTGDLFTVLGVRPVLGRVFTEEETWSDVESGVILSWRVWQESFGGDPGIVDRTVRLDRRDVTVIGVMPAGLRFPSEATDVWLPMGWDPSARTQAWFRRAHMVRVVGRLAPDVPIERARQRLAEVAAQLQREHPDLNRGMEADLAPLRESFSAGTRTPLLLLLGAVALLLLTACANVGNLVLVRGMGRRREIAVRSALGASRGRVMGQLLVESVLLAVAGGGVGMALGAWGTRLLAVHRPLGIEALQPIGMDLRVVAFAAGVTALSAVLFGLAPAIRSARGSPAASLRETRRTSAASGTVRAGSALVVTEVALALLLAVGAGLLTRSLWRLRNVDPGFDTTNVLTLAVSLPSAGYLDREAVVGFWDQLLERVRNLPGVESAGAVSSLPLTDYSWSSDFTAAGWPAERFGIEVVHREIQPGYLETLRVPLIRGRLFDERDRAGAERTVLINETLARREFGDEDPIGQRIAFDRVAEPGSVWRTIIGIVGDEQQAGPVTGPRPEFLAPFPQDWSRQLYLVARTAGEPGARLGAIRAEIADLDPALPVHSVRTLEQIRSASMADERFIMALFGLFAAFSLVLAMVGVYGVAAQVARARTHEIGIRMALGAASSDVVRMIIGRGMLLVAAGLALGFAASLLASRVLSGLLFGTDARDPAAYFAVGAILAVTALIASWAPARWAAGTDPATALRSD